MSHLSVFRNFCEPFLQHENGEQEKESISRFASRLENLSLGITVCHHLAGCVMSNGNPRDGFFYPFLTHMMDSYILNL